MHQGNGFVVEKYLPAGAAVASAITWITHGFREGNLRHTSASLMLSCGLAGELISILSKPKSNVKERFLVLVLRVSAKRC